MEDEREMSCGEDGRMEDGGGWGAEKVRQGRLFVCLERNLCIKRNLLRVINIQSNDALPLSDESVIDCRVGQLFCSRAETQTFDFDVSIGASVFGVMFAPCQLSSLKLKLVKKHSKLSCFL